MTDKTATQNLTRTQSTDDPAKMGDYLRQLGGDVDQRMAAQYYDLGRSRVPPFAVLRITAPFLVANPSTVTTGDQALFYDTVEIDTAGMVDLSRDSSKIFLNEPGYYIVGGYMLSNGWAQGAGGANDTYIKISGIVAGLITSNTVHDNGTGLTGVGCSASIRVANPLVENIILRTGYNGATGGAAMQVNFAEFWAYKHRDL